MHFALTSAAAFLALSSSTTAMPVLSSKPSTRGCAVSLDSTRKTPAQPAENILTKTIIKWNKSTGTGFNSNYCDWSHTAKDPFSVFFYADKIPGYTTTDELASVLDSWVGTWLISPTSEPAAGNAGDYYITNVVCF